MANINDQTIESWNTTAGLNVPTDEQFIQRNLAAQFRNVKSAIRREFDRNKWYAHPVVADQFTQVDDTIFAFPTGFGDTELMLHRKLVATDSGGDIRVGTIIGRLVDGSDNLIEVSWAYGFAPENPVARVDFGADNVVPKGLPLEFAVGQVGDSDWNGVADRYEYGWKHSGQNPFSGDLDYGVSIHPVGTAVPLDPSEWVMRKIEKRSTGLYIYPWAPAASGTAHDFQFCCTQQRPW
tara:strand:+ start:1452 stop:2162 length:711 start_codon:yes stop_codon:yes gene_type:complete